MRIARANAIPETAFVISLALTVLYGALQMALVGFNQISADGATFIGDHAAVAYYNNPTSTNATYAQQVGSSVFTHANGTYSASNPSNGTYEVDYNASEKTFASFFPSSLTTTSRIIEPSQSTSTTPLGGCALGRLNIAADGEIDKAEGPTVGLLQTKTATTLFDVVSDRNGNNAINLVSNGVNGVDSRVNRIKLINTALAKVAKYVGLLAGPLDKVTGSLETLLGSVGLSNVNAVVSGDVVNQFDLALSGTLTASNLQTSVGMQAQINTALGPVLGPLYGTNVMTTLNTVFTTAGQPTPFASGGLFASDGPLMAISGYMQELGNIDLSAPSSC